MHPLAAAVGAMVQRGALALAVGEDECPVLAWGLALVEVFGYVLGRGCIHVGFAEGFLLVGLHVKRAWADGVALEFLSHGKGTCRKGTKWEGCN